MTPDSASAMRRASAWCACRTSTRPLRDKGHERRRACGARRFWSGGPEMGRQHASPSIDRSRARASSHLRSTIHRGPRPPGGSRSARTPLCTSAHAVFRRMSALSPARLLRLADTAAAENISRGAMSSTGAHHRALITGCTAVRPRTSGTPGVAPREQRKRRAEHAPSSERVRADDMTAYCLACAKSPSGRATIALRFAERFMTGSPWRFRPLPRSGARTGMRG